MRSKSFEVGVKRNDFPWSTERCILGHEQPSPQRTVQSKSDKRRTAWGRLQNLSHVNWTCIYYSHQWNEQVNASLFLIFKPTGEVYETKTALAGILMEWGIPIPSIHCRHHPKPGAHVDLVDKVGASYTQRRVQNTTTTPFPFNYRKSAYVTLQSVYHIDSFLL